MNMQRQLFLGASNTQTVQVEELEQDVLRSIQGLDGSDGHDQGVPERGDVEGQCNCVGGVLFLREGPH